MYIDATLPCQLNILFFNRPPYLGARSQCDSYENQDISAGNCRKGLGDSAFESSDVPFEDLIIT